MHTEKNTLKAFCIKRSWKERKKSSAALFTRAILLNVPETGDLVVISFLKENVVFTFCSIQTWSSCKAPSILKQVWCSFLKKRIGFIQINITVVKFWTLESKEANFLFLVLTRGTLERALSISWPSQYFPTFLSLYSMNSLSYHHPCYHSWWVHHPFNDSSPVTSQSCHSVFIHYLSPSLIQLFCAACYLASILPSSFVIWHSFVVWHFTCPQEILRVGIMIWMWNWRPSFFRHHLLYGVLNFSSWRKIHFDSFLWHLSPFNPSANITKIVRRQLRSNVLFSSAPLLTLRG